MQQTLAHLEAAAGMRRQRQPAVDQRQGAHRLGAIERQLQANQRPQGVAHQREAGDPRRLQSAEQLPGHRRQAVAGGQRTGVLPGPVMVITHQLILFLQRRALRQPVAAAPAQTGAEDHHRRATMVPEQY